MFEFFKTENLFSPERSLVGSFLSSFEYPWQALSSLKSYISALGQLLDNKEFTMPKAGVWVHRSAEISPSVYIAAPCIIDENACLRHGAFVRGCAVIGKGCVVGNSSEVKNSVLYDGALIPHFNYVGDSILGFKAHLGAGVILSNVKADKTSVTVRCGKRNFYTGLKKLGAMLGDFAEIGCNSVLNPGTVIGVNSNIYPLCNVRGAVPPDSIYKGNDNTIPKSRGLTK